MNRHNVAPAHPFSIGDVLKDSFRILGRHFIPFVSIFLIVDLVWRLALQSSLVADALELGQRPWVALLIDSFAWPIIVDIQVLATVFAVLRSIRGERASFNDFARVFD